MTLEQSFIHEAPFHHAAERKHDSPASLQTTLLGRSALEHGFVMLGEIQSAYEEVRVGLMDKVIDQDPAIKAIVEALDRTTVRPDTDKRPVANLAFLGPTGVGKSETAKTLATLIGSDNLIKIDCSGYSQGYEVSSLLGAPPSYVGREQKPLLAKDQVERDGTIILFDEIEKGSQQLYNLMLQIMGDGELQLNNGDKVSFRETIVILTSNLGAKEMSRQLSHNIIGFGDQTAPKDKDSIDRVAKKSFTDFFSPEFTNRLSDMIVFHPLSEQGLHKVLDVKLEQANEYYEQEFGVRLSLSDETRSHLVDIAATEPHLGARPLIRALENNVQSMFGRYTDSGMLVEGTHVHVVHENEIPDSRGVNNTPFVFTAKRDYSIRKQPRIRAIEAPHTEPQ